MISILATRVRSTNIIDWEKLVRVLKYLNGTRNYHLKFSIDDMRIIKWYMDASFAVNTDFNIHQGVIMMWGTGATKYGSIQDLARRQKLLVLTIWCQSFCGQN